MLAAVELCLVISYFKEHLCLLAGKVGTQYDLLELAHCSF